VRRFLLVQPPIKVETLLVAEPITLSLRTQQANSLLTAPTRQQVEELYVEAIVKPIAT